MVKLICSIIFISACVCFLSSVNVHAYDFEWDENHPNDNVNEYRIYYRKNSENYDKWRYKTVDVSEEVTNDPCDSGTGKCSWSWVPTDSSEEYCFVMTALDDHDFESDLSDTAGNGSRCKVIVFDTSDGNGDGDSGSGGGGGCFVELTIKP
jgi:hypothetical protein